MAPMIQWWVFMETIYTWDKEAKWLPLSQCLACRHIHSFIEDLITECLLHDRHCSKYRGFSREQQWQQKCALQVVFSLEAKMPVPNIGSAWVQDPAQSLMLSSASWLQVPAFSSPWREAEMAPVAGLLSCPWETWIEFLALNISPRLALAVSHSLSLK